MIFIILLEVELYHLITFRKQLAYALNKVNMRNQGNFDSSNNNNNNPPSNYNGQSGRANNGLPVAGAQN